MEKKESSSGTLYSFYIKADEKIRRFSLFINRRWMRDHAITADALEVVLKQKAQKKAVELGGVLV